MSYESSHRTDSKQAQAFRAVEAQAFRSAHNYLYRCRHYLLAPGGPGDGRLQIGRPRSPALA